MSSHIHIVLASDANYMPGLEVTKSTMLASCSAPERLVFHVFDDAALANIQTSQTIQTSKPLNLPLWNGSLMPYLRLFLPQLLPEVDRVVYSDVDTIWNRDVCELWDGVVNAEERRNGGEGRGEGWKVRGEEGAIYWVRDFRSMRDASGSWIDQVAAGEGVAFDWTRYACSGICVLNLKKMRAMNFTARVLDLYAKYGVPRFPDQDVLNVIFNRDAVLLPSVWGAMGDPSNLPPEGERCVYHLTGVGRHFHDATPPVYPPQYLLWWTVREGLGVGGLGDRANAALIPNTYRILAALWPLHSLARLLPLRLRERIVRQWFFARVLIGG